MPNPSRDGRDILRLDALSASIILDENAPDNRIFAGVDAAARLHDDQIDAVFMRVSSRRLGYGLEDLADLMHPERDRFIDIEPPEPKPRRERAGSKLPAQRDGLGRGASLNEKDWRRSLPPHLLRGHGRMDRR